MINTINHVKLFKGRNLVTKLNLNSVNISSKDIQNSFLTARTPQKKELLVDLFPDIKEQKLEVSYTYNLSEINDEILEESKFVNKLNVLQHKLHKQSIFIKEITLQTEKIDQEYLLIQKKMKKLNQMMKDSQADINFYYSMRY
eukprot:EST43642.1 Hypothetical protein SS50377_16685 [Spironucleus salmonicida]